MTASLSLGLVGDFRGFALEDLVPLRFGDGGGVQDHAVPLDEDVEEPPQGREVVLCCGERAGVLLEVASDVAGSDLMELPSLPLRPRQKSPHGQGVSRPGVAVGELSLKKVIPGRCGGLSGLKDNCRQELPF